jgi:phosphatidyl-myo-inositol dimannoside synthase
VSSNAQQHTLVITNDYPPRPGGIQTFIYEMVKRFPADQVTVLTSHYDEAENFDASNAWRVVRSKAKTLFLSRKNRNLVKELIAQTGATRVVFGAAAPLGLMARSLRNCGVEQIVAISHGHEVGWASTPGTNLAIKAIVRNSNWFTYLGSYTLTGIRRAASNADVDKFRQLTPGVDTESFNPNRQPNGQAIRHSIGYSHRAIIVCVARLMPRKGQDRLIESLRLIQKRVPHAALLIVGSGPYESKLKKLAASCGVEEDVYFTGKVPQEHLPLWYAAGDVFAMPCRTRNRGWDVEGLGIVFLEASATGLAVVAGNSGGAPDAVLDGKTGLVVDGNSLADISNALIGLLSDPDRATAMGQAGRLWVEQAWTWDHSYARLNAMLSGLDPDAAL